MDSQVLIKIPKLVPEALDIDKEYGNHLWRYSINKDMPKIENSVDEYGGDPSDLILYQQITGHMIFDVKIGKKIWRKVRFVVDGHNIEAPSLITYIAVVSSDSIRICLTISALNDLDFLVADVYHAYTSAPCC